MPVSRTAILPQNPAWKPIQKKRTRNAAEYLQYLQFWWLIIHFDIKPILWHKQLSQQSTQSLLYHTLLEYICQWSVYLPLINLLPTYIWGYSASPASTAAKGKCVTWLYSNLFQECLLSLNSRDCYRKFSANFFFIFCLWGLDLNLIQTMKYD